jgi:hypothetical protein
MFKEYSKASDGVHLLAGPGIILSLSVEIVLLVKTE